MIIDGATFESLNDPPAPGLIIRLTVTGSDFTEGAVPFAAKVGDIDVIGIHFDYSGAGFVGYLKSKPAEGAVLRVGYLDGGLQDTPFTYTETFV